MTFQGKQPLHTIFFYPQVRDDMYIFQVIYTMKVLIPHIKQSIFLAVNPLFILWQWLVFRGCHGNLEDDLL